MKSEEIIYDIDYLYRAFKKSKNRRSYTISAVRFEGDIFANLNKLSNELKTHTYKVAGYTTFEVSKPKHRIIKACKFRDKIVQHVICDNFLVPELPKMTILDNYAGQRGKGTGLAVKRTVEQITDFYQKYGDNGYFYKGDIHKFYYSIDHEIAKHIMHEHSPEHLHWIIDEFIDSTSDSNVGIGLALGNQINTVVSCLYLDGLDHFIKSDLGIEYYGRYADDFWLACDSKEKLANCVKQIEGYIVGLKLQLNPKSQIIKFHTGLPFLGCTFTVRGGKVVIKLANGKRREFRRKFNRMLKLVKEGKMNPEVLERSYTSWKAHVQSKCTDLSVLNYYERKMSQLRGGERNDY